MDQTGFSARLWQRLPEGAAALAAQLFRFGISGALLSLIGFVTYVVPAVWLGVAPLLAYAFSSCFTVSAGYALHSRLSFAGHGGRDRMPVRGSRFAAVALVSFTLNSFFVWLLTGPLGGSPWWPVLPMVTLTPMVTFLLNRQWVFQR
jgi:putative flippase GtrA